MANLLPSVNLKINNIIYGLPENGKLLYEYKPFMNLKVFSPDQKDLVELRLNSGKAEINITEPVILDTEVAYDESVNLLINDKNHPIKLVNSRFYLTSSSSYNIADRKGNLDTNIYTEDNFKIEAGLIKTVRSVITLDFLGIKEGGSMPVGNYNFYFKLADADGNESDFISESGQVVCYIGAVNNPKSIRGGQLDEISDKVIKFRLNNLDLAYDYINIYYTRTTGNDSNEITKTYRITDKFKINKLDTEISITGYENHVLIDDSEINIQYTNFDSVKTNENCQNITFAGNVTKNNELFLTLEKYSLFITPEIVNDLNIGNLNSKYIEQYPSEGYEYYNPDNIYYKLGYWDKEIYRLGIIYILPDYTLSPVFNIRGIKELSDSVTFSDLNITDNINYGDDYIIEGSNVNNPENAKGIFRINTEKNVFNDNSEIKPIGLKFNFNGSVIEGIENKGLKGLSKLTKGFFIVRQKRIPTILAQSVGIATSSKSYTPILKGSFNYRNIVKSGSTTQTLDTTYYGYFAEGFLKKYGKVAGTWKPIFSFLFSNLLTAKPKLERNIFKVDKTFDGSESVVLNNALLCPEANLRKTIFSNFFNSSEFVLEPYKYSNPTGLLQENGEYGEAVMFSLGNLTKNTNNTSITTNLLLIEPGIELIRAEKNKFSSLAGSPIVAYKHSDVILGNVEDVSEVLEGTKSETEALWSFSDSKVRGEYNTYIGTDSNNIQQGKHYNIFQKNYDFDNNWKDYFRIRYNDSSSFLAISDRVEWKNINNSTQSVYRGDCYINTYTHRMNWNFIDPELPTNSRVVDPWTWFKNYRVRVSNVITNANGVSVDDFSIDDSYNSTEYTGDVTAEKFQTKKLLQLFTYGVFNEAEDNTSITAARIASPGTKRFKKYSDINGTFGAEKMNRADVNSVPLGHWVTFKICSNINLSLRDTDFNRPEEEAIHRRKRGFHPFQTANPKNKLPESDVINRGVSKTLGDKFYFEIPDVPFIKTNFSNRIYHSELLQESSFQSGSRIFKSQNYQDYTMEYGAIVKLIEWYGTLIAVMEHGILQIPVNERAMMTNASGENVYINTETILPKNPRVISNTFGSVWSDSIVKTPRFIYGIDTIGKKIWRTNGQDFELISDMKIQKFLNDNINLRESDRDLTIGKSFIKSHYNAFKQDIMFTFKYLNVEWNLCWNEILNKWITKYTWIPEFSENINNIFYTFANTEILNNNKCYLYKHGFAGTTEESGNIKPTFWYNKQHPFEFEFVVIGVQGIQKIFDNLKIISNLTKPESFYYEIIGEGFEWNKYKSNIYKLTTDNQFKYILQNNTTIKKLPYILYQPNFIRDRVGETRDITILENNKTKEKLINCFQQGLDIKTEGRVKGNMQYVEDSWDIQIQPITFKYAYLNDNNLILTNNNQMRIRDKYIKIRVRYDGEQYAIINALKTLFTLSYA